MKCYCCLREVKARQPDPWEGRLDGYCEDCALARCDAFPGECGLPRQLSEEVRRFEQDFRNLA